MANETLPRDANNVVALGGVTAGGEIRALRVDPLTGRLLVSSTGGGGTGDVTGPGSSTDNAIARFDGAGGKTLQNSLLIIDDSGNLSGVNNRTGVDTNFVSGTAGASGKMVMWDANGDAIDSTITAASLSPWAAKTAPTGTVVGTSDTQSLTNKTLDNTNTVTLKDTLFTLQDDGDATKQLRFQLSGISTSTTRTLTVPDATDTLVLLAATQTLTNKTLTAPVINSPTGIVKSDVGLGNVDNTSDATKNAAAVSLTNKTLDNTNTVTLKDTLFTLQDDGDATKQVRFQLSGLTTGNTRTITIPDSTDTMVLLAATQTLTNKTLTAPSIADFTNANHTHQNAAGGGTLDGAAIGAGTVAAARLGVMTGDSGAGGAKGAVPAPASGDAAAGKFLKADGTWTAPSGGSPGGSDTQVQFNDSSSFGGDAGLTYNKTRNQLTAGTYKATQQTLTDGATINWDADSGSYAKVTLGGNRTLAAPTNLATGGRYILEVIQDGTGSRTLTWNSAFKFPGGTAPVLTSTASGVDVFEFYSPDGTNLRLLTATFGF